MHHPHRGTGLKLRILSAMLMAVSPLAAQALGLGSIVVNSGLDEPLNGQIQLISPTANELKTLKVSLGTREDFDIAGVDRAAHLFDIKYTITQASNGQHVIKVTTDNPIREPFLHFLIQVEWNGGKLIREYSALLDPPQWVSGKPSDVNVPEIVSSEPVSSGAPVAAEMAPPVAAVETLPAYEELPPIGSEPGGTQAAAPADMVQPEAAAAAAPQPEAVTAAEPAAADTQPPSPAAAAEPMAPADTTPMTSADSAAAPAEQPLSAPAEPVQEMAASPAMTEPGVASGSAAMSEYGPVRKGDTLSGITQKIAVDRSLTPQQVMIALLRANPSAFHNNNVNILKTGKILKIPDFETIAAIPGTQAAREFRAQYDSWQEYKLKLAGASRVVAVADSEPSMSPEAKTAPVAKGDKAGKPDQTAKKKPASSKAEPVDLLKIVRANLDQDLAEETTKTPGVDTTKQTAREQQKLNDRVATLEEAIESKQMQNKDMRERVGKLQEQVKNTERLIDLENKDLALAQKAAADKAAAAGAKPVPAPAVTAKKPQPAPVPPKAEESFLDSLLAGLSGAFDNTLTLMVLGAVGVLAAGMGGIYALRRRRASREFSESILSGNSVSSDVSITDTSGQVAASDTSFLSDFSQGGMGNVHTDEVDPIAEAEVYLAYGRDEQAEEILKDAVVKDPARQELKGKLLEIYFQRNDVGAFETLAEELYAQLEGKGGKVWDKVEEMGRKLSPNNPMFRGGKPAAGASASVGSTTAPSMAPAAATTLLVSDQASDVLEFDTMQMKPEQEPASEALEPEASGGLDFNLDFTSSTESAPSAPSMDMSLDLDATDSSSESSGGLDMDFNLGSSASSEQESGGIDFSLGDMSGSTEESGGADSGFSIDSGGIDFSSSSSADQGGGGLDFSTEGLGDVAVELDSVPETGGAEIADAGLPGWDETATKLDLAKAYIDMGDSEGARSILDEVMSEGNDQQKSQARELAAQIAA